MATLLTDGLMTLDTPEEADQQTERAVEAVLTGLTRESPRSWPTPRSTHTGRRAKD
ncbi:hypothetical protein [Streptomyces sp. 184]|uniref:hypothetical protein n=1 Tax=Streptomyces sp. 184 TaxID=1827526 RepID=UPI0038918EAE